MEKKESDTKTPMPPLEETYYLPVKFLEDLARTLDFKIKILCTTVGYGFVTLRISVYNGKVANVHYNDEISMKTLVDHYFPKSEDDNKVDNA